MANGLPSASSAGAALLAALGGAATGLPGLQTAELDAGFELDRLREELAASREREAWLVGANQTLRSTVSRLTAIPALDEYLGSVMVAINEVLGARASTLWTLDYEAMWGRLAMTAVDGHWGKEPPSFDGSTLKPEFPFDAAVVSHFSGMKAPRFTWNIQQHENVDPGTRAWLRHLETVALQELPIVIAEATVAVLAIHCEMDEPFPADKLELAVALSQQLGLAIHTTRLAEESKKAAIAREREEAAEQRAAELAKANRALKKSISSLAGDGEIDAFLGQVLRSITDQVGSPSSTLWFFDWNDANRAGLHLVYENGKVVPGDGHPIQSRQSFHDNRLNDGHQRLLRGEQFVMCVATYHGFQPGQREYLQGRGIALLLSSPMMIGSRALGAFVLHFPEEREFRAEELELVRALSDEAALALELTHRAEQAKQAAIAREQEKAALERAAELAKANAALRRSVDSLVDLDSIDAFLSVSLQTIAEVLQVPSACFWKTDNKFSHLQLIYERGVVTAGKESGHPNATEPVTHAGGFAFDEDGKLKTDPFLSHIDDPLCPFTPVQRAMLRSIDVRALINIPIVLKGESVATITARLTHPIPDPTPARLELIRALANQAALALQMSELAEQAKQAAIVREQEEAATQRAAVLARANAAMAKTVGRLVEQPDIRNFVGEVLSVFATEFRALGAEFGGYNGKQRKYDVVLSFEGATGTISGEENDWQKLNRKMYPRDRPRENAIQANRINHVHAEEIYTSPSYAPFRDKLKEQGVRTVLGVPVFLKDECLGAVCLRLDHDRTLTASEEELAFALAQQLALALQLTRLAEEAKQAAIAVEREQAALERVAELARANNALRANVDALVELESIDAFLSVSLRAIADVLEVPSACFWRQEGGFAHLLLVYEGGVVKRGEESCHPNAHVPTPHDRSMSYDEQGRLRQEPHVIALEESDVPLSPAQREMFERLGVRALINIPVTLGKTAVAMITARLTESMPDPTPARLELIRALANQAALALRVTELAEEAKQAAIAVEREQAAVSRTAELMRANRAISSSLAKLTAYPEVESFLGQVLVAIVTELGEANGGVWLYESALNQVALRLSLEDGVFHHGPWTGVSWVAFEDQGRDAGMGDGALSRKRAPSKQVKVHPWPEIESRREWDPYRESLRAGGFKCLMEVPMFVGSELIGYYAIRARHHNEFSAAEIELAQALANQAALACHVKRLADNAVKAAEQSAVAEERNRLARDIHDTLAQGFAAIAMQLQGAARERASLPRAVRPYLERAMDLARENLAEARRSVGALRSSESRSGGFSVALAKIVERIRKDTAARMDLRMEHEAFAAPREVEDELLRIAQEALSNASRHGMASHIVVEMARLDASVQGVRLRIRDDGRGFDPDAPTAGYGLGIMQERAQRIGATLTVITEPGAGTEVVVMCGVPKEAEDA